MPTEQSIHSIPAPLPSQAVAHVEVVGYVGRFGPGRQALLIGGVSVGLEACAFVFWMFAPDELKLLFLVVAAWTTVVTALLYLLLLPIMLAGVVRAITAWRLNVEPHARLFGGMLNGVGIGLWLVPILRVCWRR